MIIHDLEQGSEEWLNIRIGKFTGSNFHLFLGNSIKKANEIWKKAAERITKTRCDSDKFSNKHTERGHKLEAEARIMYELITSKKVKEVGFISLDDYTGCSPDGLVEDNGMIEIKCPDNHLFLKQIIKKTIAPMYKTQIQFNLFVSNREWCDYIGYNPNFPDLYIQRVTRDEKYIINIKECLDKCNAEVGDIIIKMKGDLSKK